MHHSLQWLNIIEKNHGLSHVFTSDESFTFCLDEENETRCVACLRGPSFHLINSYLSWGCIKCAFKLYCLHYRYSIICRINVGNVRIYIVSLKILSWHRWYLQFQCIANKTTNENIWRKCRISDSLEKFSHKVNQ